MVFPVVVCGCESWTIKKAEHQRTDAFELQCWRRFLRVTWTARRSSQSILKEISPGCSLEGLMLKLKLQYFGYLTRRADSPEKTLMLGMIEGGRRRGRQRMRWLGGITHSMGVRLNELWEVVKGVCCSPRGRKESDTTGRLKDGSSRGSARRLERPGPVAATVPCFIGKPVWGPDRTGFFQSPGRYLLSLLCAALGTVWPTEQTWGLSHWSLLPGGRDGKQAAGR